MRPPGGAGAFVWKLSMEPIARHLILHAAIVLLIGLVYGVPYARAIKSGAPANIVHSWRVAHLSIPLGATLMFAVAGILSFFAISAFAKWLIVILLSVSAYAFCISTALAAITGDRGLASGARGLARLVYLGNVVGAVTSMAAALVIVYAAFVSL